MHSPAVSPVPIADRIAAIAAAGLCGSGLIADDLCVIRDDIGFSAISTVPMGAQIVTATCHPVVGLLIDAWHVLRAGTSLADLHSALQPEMIFGVEIDDAALEVVGTLFEDTVESRLLRGDGTFDLEGLVATLRNLGFDGPWGVEILSESFRLLPVEQAMKLAAESARTVLR